MNYFVSEITHQDLDVMSTSLRRAQALYDENLEAYVNLVLRRLFAKIIVRATLSIWLTVMADRACPLGLL